MLIAAGFFAAGAVLLRAAGADPAEVLERATAKVRALGDRLPNFTCVETVVRESFRPTGAVLPRPCATVLQQRQHPTLDMVLRPFSTDRLRLDVTLTRRGEIFSWAGAREFRDGDLDQLVTTGPLSTGAFGGFLMAVFSSDSPRFTFVRRLEAGGRSLLEYRFQVSRETSHYRVRSRAVPGSWVYTAFSGILQLDAETADVVHLTVETESLPAETGTCMSHAELDYAPPAQIGTYQIPLPVQMRQRFVAPDGMEDESTTAFTACREYKGESTLTFVADGEGMAPAATAKPAPVEPLPAGLRFLLALTEAISTDTAAAGDRFSGTLAEPLKDAHNRLLAPKGAAVEGRLLSVECYRRPPHVVLALRPDTVEIAGVKTPLAASPDLRWEMEQRRVNGSRRIQFMLPRRGEERSGVFLFPGENVIVPAGFRSQWVTMAARGESGAGRP